VASDDAEKSLSRARLMERSQRGDRNAFQLLFQDIGPLITRFVRRRVIDQAEAEDVCQESMLAIFKSRHTYESGRPFEPWMFAIVRNVASAHFRRTSETMRRVEMTDEIPEFAGEDTLGMTIEMREAFESLSPDQIEALLLTKIQGLSVADASKIAGASVASIKVRVHRAYQTLKKSMRG
jgi:RNA polymerase sigma-70 factor (ECF subfamily)